MAAEDWISRLTPRWYIALLRIFMGYYFLFVGVRRVLDLMGNREALTKRYDDLAAVYQFPWFRHYLDAVIAPIHGTTLFTALLTVAPLLLGLSLVLGLFTRTSTLLGILMVLNIYLIRFHDIGEPQMLFYQLQIVSLLVLFFAGAGRTFGVDALFWRSHMQTKYGREMSKRFDPVQRGESRASRTPESIPLSGGEPRRVEDTLGRFSSQVGRPAKPAPPGGGPPTQKT